MNKCMAVMCVLICSLPVFCRAAGVANPSFEADTYNTYPGLASGNGGSVTGWTLSDPDGVGLNPAASSPFANNGITPDGDNVLFIRSNHGVSTTITGLVSGASYRLSYRYNARYYAYTTDPDRLYPEILTRLDGDVIQSGVEVQNLEAANNSTMQYVTWIHDFTATASEMSLSVSNVHVSADDTTLLLDDIRVEQVTRATDGWMGYLPWTDEASSGVSSANTNTHAYNMRGDSAATINGVVFNATTISQADINVANVFQTSGWENQYSGHVNNLTALGAPFSNFAATFKYPTTTATPKVLVLRGLIPGWRYKTTFYAIGFGPRQSRQGVFTVNGGEAMVINHNAFGQGKGTLHRCIGTANSDGQLVYTNSVKVNGYHLYGVANELYDVPVDDVIIADAFSGLNGIRHYPSVTRIDLPPANTPDHGNLPGGSWFETGNNTGAKTYCAWGVFRPEYNAGGGISIESTGGYIKPTNARVQAELRTDVTGGAGSLARGVGLGFYNITSDPGNREVSVGFTGLVLTQNGALYFYSNTGGTATYSSSVAFGGTFSTSESYRLSYKVQFSTGRISDITLEGSSADYSSLENDAAGYFIAANTKSLAITSSSNITDTGSRVDNLIFSEVPPTGTCITIR